MEIIEESQGSPPPPPPTALFLDDVTKGRSSRLQPQPRDSPSVWLSHRRRRRRKKKPFLRMLWCESDRREVSENRGKQWLGGELTVDEQRLVRFKCAEQKTSSPRAPQRTHYQLIPLVTRLLLLLGATRLGLPHQTATLSPRPSEHTEELTSAPRPRPDHRWDTVFRAWKQRAGRHSTPEK